MKFADLPIGTKIIVENTVLIDYFTKVDETHYTAQGYDLPLPMFWNMDNTDGVYPLLEWEDELWPTTP